MKLFMCHEWVGYYAQPFKHNKCEHKILFMCYQRLFYPHGFIVIEPSPFIVTSCINLFLLNKIS
jgi:hypothetical protein